MNEQDIKNLIEKIENEDNQPQRIKQQTKVGTEEDKIPVIIDIGYYTSPEYWGKVSETPEETLQFYINTATIYIDRLSSSTFGSIFECWNKQDDEPGYITNKQRVHIRRAVAILTDIFENADFDATKGSFSLSVAGLSVSQSNTDNNLIIPEACLSELIEAGFYQPPFSTMGEEEKKINSFYCDNDISLYECMDYSTADSRYIRQYQDLPDEYIAITDNKRVIFKPFTSFNFQDELKREIKINRDSIANLRVDVDLNTGNIAINKSEIQKVKNTVYTKEEVNNLFRVSMQDWSSGIIYNAGVRITFVDPNTNILKTAVSLIDNNLNNPPWSSPDAWRVEEFLQIDINEVIEQAKPFITSEVEREVQEEIAKYGSEFNNEYKGNIYEFDNAEAFNQFINANPELTAEMFEDVIYDYALKSSPNTFLENNQFNKEVHFSDAFKIKPENRSVRFVPKQDAEKWLYFGDPNENKYFNGIDLNDRVKLLNVKTPTSAGDAANKQYVDSQTSSIANNLTQSNNRITALETKLNNETFIDYKGEWNSNTTYALSDSITYSGHWYVSNRNNNRGNTPNGTSGAWVLISGGPSVNLDYYARKDASNTFTQTNYFNGNITLQNSAKLLNVPTPSSSTDAVNKRYVDELYNLFFPIGSVVMTADGSTHKLVQLYPNSFTEITASGGGYLAVSSGTGTSGSNTYNLKRSDLPNVNLSHYHDKTDTIYKNLQGWNFGTGGQVWDAVVNRSSITGISDLYLNGGVRQTSIDKRPQTIGVRMWKVIRLMK